MKKLLYTALSVLIVSNGAFAQVSKKQTIEFDNYIKKAVVDWKVPGLAIIVIKDGQVIFKNGYGILELGKNDKVDTKTMFAIASTTKAMTAACAAMLVDEGKLHWDDKVTDYLPGFQLFDPYVTRELTVRDLFLHDSGLGNADFLWGAMSIPSDDVLYRLRMIKPSYSFRNGFIYQNIFYLAAGKVIEKASGMPWEEFIRKRIFIPLNMDRTVPKIKYTVGMGNLATPHFEIDSVIQVIQKDTADAIAPAGAVWSCVEDMGKWVACMLDSTKYGNGQRLLKPATWAMLIKPQTFVSAEQFYPTAQITKPHWTTYGLGWFQQDYKGQKVDFHTGSLNGFVAINGMLVDKKTGVYILANLDHAELRHALMFKAFDLFALGGDSDWSAQFLKLYAGIKAKADSTEKADDAKRVPNTKPSHDLNDYTGQYTDPLYGQVIIERDGSNLKVNINNYMQAAVQHWQYDTFKGYYNHKEDGKATIAFETDPNGKIGSVNVDGMVLSRVVEK